jgi:uncharacterized protein YbjT (DUF2867 family)
VGPLQRLLCPTPEVQVSGGLVTLLGGTGFVGRALAARLAACEAAVRVVARQAASVDDLPPGVQAISGDVRDRSAMRQVLAGSDAAVYLPGRVHGHRRASFHEIHVQGAVNCAEAAAACGVSRFLYLSALGVAPDAPAWSDQTKAEGEQRVVKVFPGAISVRPSLVLGPGDHFSTEMLGLMRRLPLMPVIGPDTRVQPVHIDDLVEGLGELTMGSRPTGCLVQAAGPRVWRMAELLGAMRDRDGLRCRLLPLPDPIAMVLAAVAGLLPGAPLCRDQVRLMRTDKIADPTMPGLQSLGISSRGPLDVGG